MPARLRRQKDYIPGDVVCSELVRVGLPDSHDNPTAAAGRQAFGAVLAGRGSHGEYSDGLHSDAYGHGPLHRRDVCFMERGLCWRPWHLSGV